jgi:hypothetical protein
VSCLCLVLGARSIRRATCYVAAHSPSCASTRVPRCLTSAGPLGNVPGDGNNSHVDRQGRSSLASGARKPLRPFKLETPRGLHATAVNWGSFLGAPHLTLRVAPLHPRNSDEITGGAGMNAGHAGYDMRSGNRGRRASGARRARLGAWSGDACGTFIGDARKRDPVRENVSLPASLFPVHSFAQLCVATGRVHRVAHVGERGLFVRSLPRARNSFLGAAVAPSHVGTVPRQNRIRSAGGG